MRQFKIGFEDENSQQLADIFSPIIPEPNTWVHLPDCEIRVGQIIGYTCEKVNGKHTLTTVIMLGKKVSSHKE